jgi:hypothetical protein
MSAPGMSAPGKDKPLKDDECVISADKKNSIQARRRNLPTLPVAPKRPMRVEHEYGRCGAWAYMAALDVHHARVFGRCETTTGIAPFDRLVEQVMTRPPTTTPGVSFGSSTTEVPIAEKLPSPDSSSSSRV